MPITNPQHAYQAARTILRRYEADEANREDLQAALLEVRDVARRLLLRATEPTNKLADRAHDAHRAGTALALQGLIEEKLASPLDPKLRCQVGSKSDSSRCPKKATMLITYPSKATLRMCKPHATKNRGKSEIVTPLEA